MQTYEQLKQQLLALKSAEKLPERLTEAERADWVYGNVAMHNPAVTLEMVVRALRR